MLFDIILSTFTSYGKAFETVATTESYTPFEPLFVAIITPVVYYVCSPFFHLIHPSPPELHLCTTYNTHISLPAENGRPRHDTSAHSLSSITHTRDSDANSDDKLVPIPAGEVIGGVHEHGRNRLTGCRVVVGGGGWLLAQGLCGSCEGERGGEG
ncbi:hypothetical protein C8R45DRAFT_289499 [Mycena sanguinolenta]|nr:hypothetical protein C8R45DRAFT_289499 [Mycena sanguinolenta]